MTSRIHHQITGRHRHAAPVIEYPRQDIRAAAGAAGAVDQSVAETGYDSTVERVKENVIGNPVCGQKKGQHVHRDRVGDDGNRRAQAEFASAQEAPADDEERHIADENHQADRPVCEVVDQLRNAADAARGQMRRNKKETQANRLRQ